MSYIKTLTTITFLFLSATMSASEISFINQQVSIHDITLTAKDVQELAKFYTKIGFTRDPHVNNESIVVFPLKGNELVIHKSNTNSEVTVGFKVKDLDSIIRSLKKEGIKHQPPKGLRPGLIGISLKDPNGNTIEFMSSAK